MLKKTLLAYTIGFAFSPPANADGIEIAAVDFDRETLKSLGVDPNISHYFSRSARFLPGEYSLAVSVNGEKKGNRFTTGDHSHRVGSHKRSNWWNSCAAKLLSDEQPCRIF